MRMSIATRDTVSGNVCAGANRDAVVYCCNQKQGKLARGGKCVNATSSDVFSCYHAQAGWGSDAVCVNTTDFDLVWENDAHAHALRPSVKLLGLLGYFIVALSVFSLVSVV
jgi:hypothetical protein